MARQRNPNRDEAMAKYLENDGVISTKQLAAEAGVTDSRIRKWKSEDNWTKALETQRSKRKRGAQPGNKNAVGGGAPYRNSNAETHGAYSTIHLEDLEPEQRDYLENLTLNTYENMRNELQLLIAKEIDLQSKIRQIESDKEGTLYIDRVVEMRVPKGEDRLNSKREKLQQLVKERDDIIWEMDSGKPESRQQKKRLDDLHEKIAALEDTVQDAEVERGKDAFKVNMQTAIKSSPFERRMKIEAELNKIHGRIIKLLDSIKSYELEQRRIGLEERKYNLLKQKISGVFEIDPETGEINDEYDIGAEEKTSESDL